MPYPGCAGCLGSYASFVALTSTSSHELCEAITDPIPGQGWYDDANGEIGDICAWQTKQIGGYTYSWNGRTNLERAFSGRAASSGGTGDPPRLTRQRAARCCQRSADQINAADADCLNAADSDCPDRPGNGTCRTDRRWRACSSARTDRSPGWSGSAGCPGCAPSAGRGTSCAR